MPPPCTSPSSSLAGSPLQVWQKEYSGLTLAALVAHSTQRPRTRPQPKLHLVQVLGAVQSWQDSVVHCRGRQGKGQMGVEAEAKAGGSAWGQRMRTAEVQGAGRALAPATCCTGPIHRARTFWHGPRPLVPYPGLHPPRLQPHGLPRQSIQCGSLHLGSTSQPPRPLAMKPSRHSLQIVPPLRLTTWHCTQPGMVHCRGREQWGRGGCAGGSGSGAARTMRPPPPPSKPSPGCPP